MLAKPNLNICPVLLLPLAHLSKRETPGHRGFRPLFLFISFTLLLKVQGDLVFSSTFCRYTL